MKPTKFGLPHLDTPSSIYEFFETCIQICENKSENQMMHRLIDGARWSVGPTCQQLQSRGGAPTSPISSVARLPTTTATPTCSSHQATSIGGDYVTLGSPEMACQWRWRMAEVARWYAGVLQPSRASVRCTMATQNPNKAIYGG